MSYTGKIATLRSSSKTVRLTGEPRQISGGTVVDVVETQPLPNGVENYRWTAVLSNLNVKN